MPTLAELRERREKAGTAVIQLRNQTDAEGFVETPEFQTNWDAANTAYNAALKDEETEMKVEESRNERRIAASRIAEDSARITAQIRANLRPDYDPNADPRANARSAPDAGTWNRAMRAWVQARSPEFDPTDREIAAMRQCRLLNGVGQLAESVTLPSGRHHGRMIGQIQRIMLSSHPSQIEGRLLEVFAANSTVWQTTDPESAGIVAEPPRILRQVEINMLAWGGLLQVCDTMTTGTAEDITLPVTDDTTTKGRRIAQNASLGTQSNPKFGGIVWGAWKYTSDVIAVTYEQLRDSWFDLEGHIGDVGGERLGRITNDECTTGTGVDMPKGIVTVAEVGLTSAGAGALTTDDIVNLEHSVDPAYRNSPTVGYMMHDTTLAVLRKLKDTQGHPIYILGQELGRRDQVNGRPIFINQSMTALLTAGAFPLLFGEMKKYRVRRVNGTRVVRDPYTQRMSNDRDLFAVLMELDGNLINAGTCPVKKLQMHA